MAHIDTSNPTRRPQQPIFLTMHRMATQPCWPHLSCHPISINNMVHIDISDPTHWPQQPIFMALRCLATQLCWPRLSYHSISATQHLGIATNQSIHNTFQALIGNVSYVCLCRCTNMYIIHQIAITNISQQAYIITLTQYLKIYITKQWPLNVARRSLAAVEQQARYGDSQARCNDEFQYLVFPNPSQLVAARTALTAASAPCLKQPIHKSQGKLYFSQTEPTCCSETHTHCRECPQYQRITKPTYSLQQVPTSL